MVLCKDMHVLLSYVHTRTWTDPITWQSRTLDYNSIEWTHPNNAWTSRRSRVTEL